MNLLAELAPFLCMAVVICAALGAYLWKHHGGSHRKKATKLVRPAQAPPGFPAPRQLYRPTAADEEPGSPTWSPQILRLRELGVSETQIAQVLAAPLEEVELVIVVDRLRREAAHEEGARSQQAPPAVGGSVNAKRRAMAKAVPTA